MRLSVFRANGVRGRRGQEALRCRSQDALSARGLAVKRKIEVEHVDAWLAE